ncbi:MAG: MBL fold metallo-hydrolase [Ignavibacteriaceae bacterium]
MSIQYKVLGKPGRDNGLFIWLNTGTRMFRILFDCGESIFHGIKQSDIKSIDYLFLSHLHIDHFAGFDYYFRRNFDREKPNYIWGPEDTSEIVHNRLRGFKWNLLDGIHGEFIVTDISGENTFTHRFTSAESFSVKHDAGRHPFNGILIDNPAYSVSTAILNHRIPSIAYRITEKDSFNISKEALSNSGLTPGKWLEQVRDLSLNENNHIEVDEKTFTTGELRDMLLEEKKGESICYLTDFSADEESIPNIITLMQNCDTVVCESQYHSQDLDLAVKNYHMTSRQTAELAKKANVKKLILFHISERYTTNSSHIRLLDDARSIFPATYFPDEWKS